MISVLSVATLVISVSSVATLVISVSSVANPWDLRVLRGQLL